MILLSLDFETTGIDPTNDRVIEVGAVLYSTGQKRVLESAGFLVKAGISVSQEITDITRITNAAVDRFGYDSHAALENVLAMADLAEAFLGQNIVRFDKRVLAAWMGREGVPAAISDKVQQKLVIDTFTDLPDFPGGKLAHMLADAPKPAINYMPHSALADAVGTIILFEQFDLDKVVERAKSPMVVVQSLHPREANEEMKKLLRPLIWNNPRKIWWRPSKRIDVSILKQKTPYELVVREDLNLDELEKERG